MKIILVLSLLFSLAAKADINPNGDFFTSGDVVNPLGNAVIIDTGGISGTGPTHDYYNLKLVASCSLLCTIEFGVFSSSNAVVNTYKMLIPTGQTVETFLENVTMVAGQKLRVRMVNSLLGTANVALSAHLATSD